MTAAYVSTPNYWNYVYLISDQQSTQANTELTDVICMRMQLLTFVADLTVAVDIRLRQDVIDLVM